MAVRRVEIRIKSDVLKPKWKRLVCVGAGLIGLLVAGCRSNEVQAPNAAKRENSAAEQSDRAVSVRLTCTPEIVVAGGVFEAVLHVTMEPGYHLYATNSPPFTAVSAELRLPAGVKAITDWSASPSPRKSGGSFIFTDSLVLRRTLKLDSNVRRGPLSIQGELRYQACTEEICWPPASLKVESTIQAGSTRKAS